MKTFIVALLCITCLSCDDNRDDSERIEKKLDSAGEKIEATLERAGDSIESKIDKLEDRVEERRRKDSADK